MYLLGLLAKLPTSLLVTSLALAASALPVESVELRMLTPADFDSTVAQGAWFIEHFSPYCHHCRAFAPTWEKLVQHYESMDDPGVHLAQVDCAANGDLCHSHGVTGYPQMNMYKNGEMTEQFKGAREWDNLVSFINKHAVHTSSNPKPQDESLAQEQQKPLPNPEGMVKALDSTSFYSFLDEGPAFIKFYAPWCGHCKKLAPIWTQLAAQLRNKLNIGEVNCDVYKDLCKRQDVKGFPTLFFYNGGNGPNLHKTEYTSGRKLEQLRRFAEMAVAPPLQEIDSEAEYEHFVKEYPVLYLLLHSSDDEQALTELREASHILLGSPKIIASSNAELHRHFSLPSAFSSVPVLLAIKDGVPYAYTSLFAFSSSYPSPSIAKSKAAKEKEAMKEWLLHNRVPSAVALNQETFQDVMNARHHPIVVIAAVQPSHEYTAPEKMRDVAREWRSMLDREKVDSIVRAEDGSEKEKEKEKEKERMKARDVVFTWMDGEKWGSWMKSMYGIKAESNAEPSVVIADHYQLIYYDTNAKGNKIAFDTQSISEAVKDVLAGKVSYKNSENILERMVRRLENLATYFTESVAAHPYRTVFFVTVFFIAFVLFLRRIMQDDISAIQAQSYSNGKYVEYARLTKEPGRLD
ncbi:hypothetical protein ACEPAG_5811 [Sanghuangporus baumii]